MSERSEKFPDVKLSSCRRNEASGRLSSSESEESEEERCSTSLVGDTASIILQNTLVTISSGTCYTTCVHVKFQ